MRTFKLTPKQFMTLDKTSQQGEIKKMYDKYVVENLDIGKLTYCRSQNKKTKNVAGRIEAIRVRGHTRYCLKSTCAECGKSKVTFLANDKNGKPSVLPHTFD